MAQAVRLQRRRSREVARGRVRLLKIVGLGPILPWLMVLGKFAPAPPKKKKYTGRTISLFLTWTLAEFWFVVSLIPEITLGKLVVLFFYISFTTFLLAYMILQAFARNMREQVLELLSYDLGDSALPLAMGGVVAALFLIPAVLVRGATFHTLDMSVVVEQLLVVAPSETFIFLFFLPHLLPGKVLRVPGWLWSQILFAAFHYIAYAANPFGMFFAFTIGVVWWQVKVAGGQYSFLGLPFVYSFHFLWNLIVIASTGSSTGSVTDALIIFFPMFGIALAGRFSLMRTFSKESPRAIAVKTEDLKSIRESGFLQFHV